MTEPDWDPIRDGWHPSAPTRRCWTCGARPVGFYRVPRRNGTCDIERDRRGRIVYRRSPRYPSTCCHAPHVATEAEAAYIVILADGGTFKAAQATAGAVHCTDGAG